MMCLYSWYRGRRRIGWNESNSQAKEKTKEEPERVTPALRFFVIRYSLLLLPLHEPYAAAGVLVNEMAVLSKGETAARDIACARLRVKLNGILLSGGVDEKQGLVFTLYNV